MDVLQRVRATLDSTGWIAEGERVVAAVSGGPDSLCLLHVLHELGVEEIAAHYDHRLRPGGEAEAERVRAMAAQLGVPCQCGRAAIEHATGEGGVEAVARRGRYEFLADTAERFGCRSIATGHTADDRVESLLMHLLRGAGIAGLRGMQPAVPLTSILGRDASPGIRILRPLLDISRSESEAFCRERGLEPIVDPSNTDPSFLRNRVRWELIPMLETYNPAVREVLLRTGRVLDGEADWREDALGRLRAAGVAWSTFSSVGFLVEELRAAPSGMLRALVHDALESMLDVGHQAGLEDVDAVVSMIREGGRRRSIVGGIEAERSHGLVILTAAGAPSGIAMFPQCQREVRFEGSPGAAALGNGWRLVRSSDPPAPGGAGWDCMGPLRSIEALGIRPPRPGDRLEAAGYAGDVRVADLLAAAHVPRPARSGWPLLVAGDRVVWVVGIRKARLPEAGDGTWIRAVAPDAGFERWRRSTAASDGRPCVSSS